MNTSNPTPPMPPPSAPAGADASLRVACWLPETEAEGPGRRAAVWLQGCPLRCEGCCNPEMLPFEGGETWASEALARELLSGARERGVGGMSLLGGEPFAQASAAAVLAQAVRRGGLSVMVYSGYTLAALNRQAAHGRPGVAALLEATDVLVDGPYLANQPEEPGGRRWVGSRNQRVHHLSDRYATDDPRFSRQNSVELRLARDGSLIINGWPGGAEAILAEEVGS